MQRHHLTKVAVMKGVYGMQPKSRGEHPIERCWAPPRCTCPRTVVRASFPVRWAISDSNRFPIPESRTWPKGSTSPSRGGNVPSREVLLRQRR